jgi:hypothetical protein
MYKFLTLKMEMRRYGVRFAFDIHVVNSKNENEAVSGVLCI